MNVSREEWDKEWRACFGRLRAKGYRLEDAQRIAREITRVRLGQRPSGPPLWLRVALRLLRSRLNIPTVEVSPMLQRFLIALGYGLSAMMPVLATSLDAGIMNEEWGAIFTALVVAFWGKFSSNTTLLGADRATWTPEEREKKLNGGQP